MCHRACFAFCFALSFFLLLFIAFFTPWYSLWSYYTGKEHHDSSYFLLFYFKIWSGAEYYVGKEKHTMSEWSTWSEADVKHAEGYYVAALVLTGLAALGALLYTLLIVVGLWHRTTAARIHERIAGFKWIVLGVGMAVLVFNIVGWASFIGFPMGLNEDELMCSGKNAGKRWCHSFLGSDTDSFDINYAWGPNAGWVCAVIATVPGLISLLLVAMVRRSSLHAYDAINA
eukprot:TRINITY_DN3948_c0_g1_i1.p2 TRINITY_DN3948_c0_g1~~TRINITY_DN3948_c0_g1_i1.p2  ORF type:complete len:229 (-),score=26.69 TRINITY_DN3948_c0_g1_i1:86-772(-)